MEGLRRIGRRQLVEPQVGGARRASSALPAAGRCRSGSRSRRACRACRATPRCSRGSGRESSSRLGVYVLIMYGRGRGQRAVLDRLGRRACRHRACEAHRDPLEERAARPGQLERDRAGRRSRFPGGSSTCRRGACRRPRCRRRSPRPARPSTGVSMRTKVDLMSAGVIGLPFENLMPGLSVNVYVLPSAADSSACSASPADDDLAGLARSVRVA